MGPCTANACWPTVDIRCRGTTINCCVADLRRCLPTTSVTGVQHCEVLRSLAMPTFVHDDPEFTRYSIGHIEPVKVIMQDLSQAMVKLSCVTDNACGRVSVTDFVANVPPFLNANNSQRLQSSSLNHNIYLKASTTVIISKIMQLLRQ